MNLNYLFKSTCQSNILLFQKVFEWFSVKNHSTLFWCRSETVGNPSRRCKIIRLLFTVLSSSEFACERAEQMIRQEQQDFYQSGWFEALPDRRKDTEMEILLYCWSSMLMKSWIFITSKLCICIPKINRVIKIRQKAPPRNIIKSKHTSRQVQQCILTKAYLII